jgi:hypothetical protein
MAFSLTRRKSSRSRSSPILGILVRPTAWPHSCSGAHCFASSGSIFSACSLSVRTNLYRLSLLHRLLETTRRKGVKIQPSLTPSRYERIEGALALAHARPTRRSHRAGGRAISLLSRLSARFVVSHRARPARRRDWWPHRRFRGWCCPATARRASPRSPTRCRRATSPGPGCVTRFVTRPCSRPRL